MSGRLLLVRHGQSRANQQGVLCSDPVRGSTAFGLTARGKAQAEQAAATLRDQRAGARPWDLWSSPFLRARQTAQIIQAALQLPTVNVDERLRERYFGELEGRRESAYAVVWRHDETDPTTVPAAGVETVQEVAGRLADLYRHLQQNRPETDWIWVTHGDVCSIAACWLQGQPLSRHRQVAPLQTAEVLILERPPFVD